VKVTIATGAAIILIVLANPWQARATEKQSPASEPTEQPASEAEGTSPEIFIPTEEISEDFAVPFPVDI
tara:strand:+ start:1197 stop:1403 length:207 start_codon:yes stop_codon:yes gene_type:complete